MRSQTLQYESNSEDDVICPTKARKPNSRATNISFVFVCVLTAGLSVQVASQPVNAWQGSVGCSKELETIV